MLDTGAAATRLVTLCKQHLHLSPAPMPTCVDWLRGQQELHICSAMECNRVQGNDVCADKCGRHESSRHVRAIIHHAFVELTTFQTDDTLRS